MAYPITDKLYLCCFCPRHAWICSRRGPKPKPKRDREGEEGVGGVGEVGSSIPSMLDWSGSQHVRIWLPGRAGLRCACCRLSTFFLSYWVMRQGCRVIRVTHVNLHRWFQFWLQRDVPKWCCSVGYHPVWCSAGLTLEAKVARICTLP